MSEISCQISCQKEENSISSCSCVNEVKVAQLKSPVMMGCKSLGTCEGEHTYQVNNQTSIAVQFDSRKACNVVRMKDCYMKDHHLLGQTEEMKPLTSVGFSVNQPMIGVGKMSPLSTIYYQVNQSHHLSLSHELAMALCLPTLSFENETPILEECDRDSLKKMMTPIGLFIRLIKVDSSHLTGTDSQHDEFDMVDSDLRIVHA
ncbi:hypothetical protein IHE45_01G048200 [Dioscorea alata]|uniref:Uncharacterized protein n=1 Tax=Dioscorea alata TaxID=55571 RepID=A0ACB7WU09_DIOAL|nr:hypothetical protein IHE45_01G048200 [Dioscorea alata]